MPKKTKKTTKTKIRDLKPKKDVKGGATSTRLRSADPDGGGE